MGERGRLISEGQQRQGLSGVCTMAMAPACRVAVPAASAQYWCELTGGGGDEGRASQGVS